MKKIVLVSLVFVFSVVDLAFAMEMAPYFNPLFVDGNQWTYLKTNGEQVVLQVMSGTVSFNGTPDVKRVKVETFDADDNPESTFLIRYYKKDSTGFYELGLERYDDNGTDATLGYSVAYTPPKHIASMNMNVGDTLETTGTYLVYGYTFSYTYATHIIGLEDITVPYGTYNALRFTATQTSTPPGDTNTYTYYVGTDMATLVEDQGDTRLELLSFEGNLLSEPPSCLGDHDGNNQVSIHELQIAVNQYLGMDEVASCNDEDGDGMVSSSELQTMINNYLQGGCDTAGDIDQYIGQYDGTYSYEGMEMGSWSVCIDASGNISGSGEHNVNSGTFTIEGTISSSGEVNATATATGQAGASAFIAEIDDSGNLDGTWYASETTIGTTSGQRVSTECQ